MGGEPLRACPALRRVLCFALTVGQRERARASRRDRRGVPSERRVRPDDGRALGHGCGVRASAKRYGLLPRRAHYRSSACGSGDGACALGLTRVSREEQLVAPRQRRVSHYTSKKELPLARPNCQTSREITRMRLAFSERQAAMWLMDGKIYPWSREKCRSALRKWPQQVTKSNARIGKSPLGLKERWISESNSRKSGANFQHARQKPSITSENTALGIREMPLVV